MGTEYWQHIEQYDSQKKRETIVSLFEHNHINLTTCIFGS